MCGASYSARSNSTVSYSRSRVQSRRHAGSGRCAYGRSARSGSFIAVLSCLCVPESGEPARKRCTSRASAARSASTSSGSRPEPAQLHLTRRVRPDPGGLAVDQGERPEQPVDRHDALMAAEYRLAGRPAEQDRRRRRQAAAAAAGRPSSRGAAASSARPSGTLAELGADRGEAAAHRARAAVPPTWPDRGPRPGRARPGSGGQARPARHRGRARAAAGRASPARARRRAGRRSSARARRCRAGSPASARAARLRRRRAARRLTSRLGELRPGRAGRPPASARSTTATPLSASAADTPSPARMRWQPSWNCGFAVSGCSHQ